jgi:hypothetical protein
MGAHFFLVVVDQFDVCCVLARELERDPPVARNPYGPLFLAITGLGMEPEAWRIHHIAGDRLTLSCARIN